MHFSEPAYSETLGREFNMVEPEDAMKWWIIRRHLGVFDFHEGDQIVRFARAHDMKVRGHCLLWDHDNPKWLSTANFTPQQLSHLLQEHIATVMKHYAGQVFAWDVVNEAFEEHGKLKRLHLVQSAGYRILTDKARPTSSRHFAGRTTQIPKLSFSTTKLTQKA